MKRILVHARAIPFRDNAPVQPILRVALVLLACMLAACGPKRDPGAALATMPGSPLIPLDSPLVTSLGRLEGPYLFVSAIQPDQIEVADPQRGIKDQFLRLTLIGLTKGEYATPPKPGAKPPTAEEKAAQAQRIEEIDAFKKKGLEEVCDGKKVWFLRMSDRTPALAYVFMPHRNPAAGEDPAPHGPAELLNALILRKGLGSMWLEGPEHPFREIMFESQLAAIAEARKTKRKGAEATNIWGRFGMTMPAAYEPQILTIGKKMGY